MRYFITILFLSLIPLTAVFSQHDASKQRIRTLYTNISLLSHELDSFVSVDTSILKFHEFDASNSFDFVGISSGLAGSPYMELNGMKNTKHDFRSGVFSFDLYSQQPEKIAFFDTYTPFTDLFYAKGQAEFQMFRVVHSRNVKPNWNASIDYKTKGTTGFFVNQAGNINNFMANTNYRSLDGKYRLYAAYYSDKISNQLNGGINDSFFFEYNNRSRSGLNVFLTEANQLYSGKNYFARQYLRLGHLNDSITDSITNKNPNVYLFHEVKLSFQRYKFNDPQLNHEYYRSFFFDSAASSDTFGSRFLSNDFYLVNYPEDRDKIRFKAGFSHFSGKLHQAEHDSFVSSLSVAASIGKSFGKLSNSLSAKYYIAGSMSDDYYLHNRFSYSPTVNAVISLDFALSKNAVPYFYQFANTNHLKWNNAFKAENHTEISASFLQKHHTFRLKTKYKRIDNYIYIDQNIECRQHDKSLHYIGAELSKDFTFKKLHFNNLMLLQYTTDDVMRFPLWNWNSLFYFQERIFKDVLLIQLGFSLRLSDAWFGYNYYAPFNLFYLQDNYKHGIYPLVDVFFNAALKKARFFVKYEHINQGYPYNEVFVFANHPLNPPSLIFGISWMFYD